VNKKRLLYREPGQKKKKHPLKNESFKVSGCKNQKRKNSRRHGQRGTHLAGREGTRGDWWAAYGLLCQTTALTSGQQLWKGILDVGGGHWEKKRDAGDRRKVNPRTNRPGKQGRIVLRGGRVHLQNKGPALKRQSTKGGRPTEGGEGGEQVILPQKDKRKKTGSLMG